MQMYKWQEDCLESWKSNDHHGIINAVTGAGKTRLSIAAIRLLISEVQNLMVRIVVPTVVLANQWLNTIRHELGKEGLLPGLFGNGIHNDPDCRIMVYVINSARESITKHILTDFALGRTVLLICDECHHYSSPQNRHIFDFKSSGGMRPELYCSIGLSATPFDSHDDKILIHALGKEIFRYDFDSASGDGIISRFTIAEINATFTFAEKNSYRELSDRLGRALDRLYKTYPGLKSLSSSRFFREVSHMASQSGYDISDPASAFMLLAFQRKTLTNGAEARSRCALSIIAALPENERILIFCDKIDAVSTAAIMIRKTFGNICAVYHSKLNTAARKRALENFRSGNARILISCKCLDEGLNVPDASTGIIMSGSSVKRQHIQRLGRIIRNSPEKAIARLYYIYIGESSDDSSYLQGLDRSNVYGYRYFTEEDVFSNPCYEYVGRQILLAAQEKGRTSAILAEIRKCLNEGMLRMDFAINDDRLAALAEHAAGIHKKNYYRLMQRCRKHYSELL